MFVYRLQFFQPLLRQIGHSRNVEHYTYIQYWQNIYLGSAGNSMAYGWGEEEGKANIASSLDFAYKD